MFRFLLVISLLLSATVSSQGTPTQRFIERMHCYQLTAKPLTPSDSVETAVQFIGIMQQRQPGGRQLALYLYRPALASQFYLKKMWLLVASSQGEPTDTTWGEAHLMQVPPRLSVRLARFVQREEKHVLPPHSVHYDARLLGSRPTAQAAAKTREREFTIRLHQAPPYKSTYRTQLDPEGYLPADLIRRLGRNPVLYRRHQRRAYRRLLRLVRDFLYQPK